MERIVVIADSLALSPEGKAALEQRGWIVIEKQPGREVRVQVIVTAEIKPSKRRRA